MAYLKRSTKSVLLLLAAEFDTNVSESNKCKEIIDAILSASDYDEETGKAFLDRIVAELEAEKLEREKVEQKEAERLQREKEIEREIAERDKSRQFELEKLKLTAASDTSGSISMRSEPEITPHKISLKDLVPKFDPKQIDISLFFMIFERQATRAKLEEEFWVSQLIPLLPSNIVEIVVKEPVEKADDFQHIKKVLFKRFKLSARALRNKLENHQRKHNALWTDLVYELRGYLENWLETLEVNDFEQLKELILTEQVKRRVPAEIREHYVESWEEIIEASLLAEKCDKFEAVKEDMKKFEPRSSGRNSFKKSQKYTPYKTTNDTKTSADKLEKKEPGTRKGSPEIKDSNFERKREIKCFGCGRAGHIRPLCPDRANKQNHPVNNLNVREMLGEGFEPYIHNVIINGEAREYLRDSGSCIDVCESDMITIDDLLPEHVWVRQPFDAACKSLPLARIEIEGDFGKIVTKAAVKPADLSQGYYLMGNRTAKLIEEKMKLNCNPVNAVVTRSKTKLENEFTDVKSRNSDSGENNSHIPKPHLANRKRKGFKGESEYSSEPQLDRTMESDGFFLPQISEVDKSLLVNVSADSFLEEQKSCSTLKELWEKGREQGNSEFSILKDRLIRITESKRGERKTQLVIPKKYREEILKLCHGPISGHLGVTKTKGRILNYFFWPQCYQEIEMFVKTCDPCQKVGKNRDKKKRL